MQRNHQHKRLMVMCYSAFTVTVLALAFNPARSAPPTGTERGAGEQAALFDTSSLQSRLVSSRTGATRPGSAEDLAREVNETMGLAASTLVALDVAFAPGAPMTIMIPIADEQLTLDLSPHSIRAPGYQVLVQVEDGSLVKAEPQPIRTMRGTVLEIEGSAVAASLLRNGLYARIVLSDEDEYWLEPLAPRIGGAAPNLHVLYHGDDIITSGLSCGAEALSHPTPTGGGGGGGGPREACGGGVLCGAELACDADYQYYLEYGSVSAVENRISNIINAINFQYEDDVEISYLITAIIVRSSGNPSSYDSASTISGLLNAFRSHWQSSHGDIQRDLAELFTGRNLSGGVIGIAWLNAVCTSSAYSVVENCCSFGCLADLSAHEMGHNWGAGHCSCSDWTMNSSLTCANQFHPDYTVPDIVSYRESIESCLTAGGWAAPGNDNCQDAFEACPGAHAGTTVSANTDGLSSCASPSPDVWYSYTPDTDGTLTLNTCSGTDYDIALSVHTDCPGDPGNEIGCDDDGCSGPSNKSLLSVSVTEGALYYIRVSGYDGANGDFTLNVSGPACGTQDTTPPVPSPMTFSSPPAPASTSSITMTATEAIDADSPPVTYFFLYTPVGGSGGDSSSWQPGRAYFDSGLETNAIYGYKVAARDGIGNPTDYSFPVSLTATDIETPTGVTFGTVTSNSIQLNATGSFTNLIEGSSGLYFDSTTGGDGGINQWVQTTSDTATGLGPDTSHSFQAKARNQTAHETPYSGTGAKITLANVPQAPTLSDPTSSTMTLNVNPNGNPSYTVFAIQCQGTNPLDSTWNNQYVNASGNPVGSAVWRTDGAWGTITIQGSQPSTEYTFAVKARNQDSIETTFGALSTLLTLDAPVTGACCFGDGSCVEDTQANCTSAGGGFGGGGTDCAPNPCDQPCAVPGDMNGDTFINGADVQGFADAMVGLFDPCADLAEPFGTLDTADTSAFVALLLNP